MSLEGRVVPALTFFNDSGVTVSDISDTVNHYRAILGNLNANVAGSFETGRREINWDGVPAKFASPNALPADFFNVNSPRGAVFSTPGSGFQVSGNTADAGTGQPALEFENLNVSYPTLFNPFSAQRLFTPVGSNTMDVTFFVPGTTIPAVTRAFGIVFADVDRAGTTVVQFFDAAGNSLFGGAVSPTFPATDGGFSFLGAFDNESASIARVQITFGNAAVGADESGSTDIVVADDFIYGEPIAAPAPPTVSDIGNPSGASPFGPIAFTVGDVNTPAGQLHLTATSSNPALVPDGHVTFGGNGANRTVIVNPVPGQSGTATITVTVTDGDGQTVTETFDVSVDPPTPNTPPTISDTGNRSAVGAIGPFTITVGDAESPANQLSVSGTSSFATLFPAGSIFVSGTGATRQILLVPAAGQTGQATITLTVTDAGGLTASDPFTITVLPPPPPPSPPPVNIVPQISDTGNVAVPFGGFSGVVPFFVSDSDAPAANLTVTATSNNQTLVPDAGVVISGTGTNRTFVVSPNAGQTGTATITLTVSDGQGGTATDTFVISVVAPAPLPAPPAGVTVFESAGANAASIQASVDAFRVAIGGGTTPGAAGSFGGIRREINWDGVPAAKENPFPGDFFNATSPRGVLLSTDGTGLAVSGAAGTAGFEFGNVNPLGPTEFAPFSSPKLFTALGSTTYDIEFRVAGTQIPAGVNSFGVVFADVDLANVSKLEFFAADGTLLLSRDILPTGTTNEGLSFLGASLPAGTLAAKVRVTSGNVILGAAATVPPGDIVVVDDFIFSEPEALPVVVKTDIFAVGSGPGVEAQVNIFNNDASFRFALFPFPGFTGGVSVSTGDVNGDGFEDVAVGAGPGGGPHVKVFDGRTGEELRSFFAYDESFRGGVFVGLGDATGDLRADLVTGTGVGGGPHVKVFDGQDLREIHSFFAFDPSFRGGVTVRLGDVSGDGFADVVVGAGVGGGPHVRVFDGRTLAELQSFFAGDPESRGGIFVGVADFLNTGSSLVTVSANGQIFAPGYIEQDKSIPVPASPNHSRVPVAAIRLDTGIVGILIGSVPGTRPIVSIKDGTSNLTLHEFAPFGEAFTGGIFVG